MLVVPRDKEGARAAEEGTRLVRVGEIFQGVPLRYRPLVEISQEVPKTKTDS